MYRPTLQVENMPLFQVEYIPLFQVEMYLHCLKYRQPHSIRNDQDLKKLKKTNPALYEHLIMKRHGREKFRARKKHKPKKGG